ncbi:MAG: ribonuclease III [Dehalococcoidia bacterium]
MDKLQQLQAALDVTFDDLALLKQSLVHRSYLNESEASELASNERLEFLGDAVLGLIVARELYLRFPNVSEGVLTTLRAQIVRGAALAPVGVRLELGSYLILGRGEEQSGGRRRRINLARALEAVLGAVYLDRGLQVTRGLILRLLAPEFAALDSDEVVLDPKSRLQQVAQGVHRVTPRYVTVSGAGPDHERRFTVEGRFAKRVVCRGSGQSKRQAQQLAARNALTSLPDDEEVQSKDEVSADE